MIDIFSRFLAPVPFLLVFGGALLIVILQQGRAASARAIAALSPLFAARPEEDRTHARAVLLRVEEVAQLHGIARTDRVRARSRFLAHAIQKLANCQDADAFCRWADHEIDDRKQRHDSAIGFWNGLADVAPAMGMAGTIIGLIGMFAGMDDPSTLGPAMGLALLTTLYGIVLANLLAGPVASRLAWLSAEELAWQRETADHIAAIARREAAPMRRPSIRDVA